MPEKKTKADKRYSVDGRWLTWHPDVEEGEDPLPDIRLPLRIKLKVIRQMTDTVMDSAGQAELLTTLAPASATTFDEMDLNDFEAMFLTWQSEYQKLSGATLGE